MVADIHDAGQPCPFFLAHQLDTPLEIFDSRLGPVEDWQVEWKYDGIRGQLVKRGGQVWLWSRGEELVTERFPEIVALAISLSDGLVLDGEIMVWNQGSPASFARLQQRIGRKTLSKKMLAEAPVTFMAYDLLKAGGQDLRAEPQHERRARLEQLLSDTDFKISPIERRASWDQFAALRAEARQRGVEGFMLKRLDAAYGQGRTKVDDLWWKWKIEPMTIDCGLIYAQAGYGRRASLRLHLRGVESPSAGRAGSRGGRQGHERRRGTPKVEGPLRKQRSTRRLKCGGHELKREPTRLQALQLVAFAKAYSGLTDVEFKQIDSVIRKTTLEKFGPVRSVKPSLVFELGFEGINPSPRHKSGIAVRFPRMLLIRTDKPLHQAKTLDDLKMLLK